MTYNDFKNKYIGHGIDFDGFYGFQCMDLAEQYNKEVVGANKIGGNAKDAFVNYDKNKYTLVINTPTGVPVAGDIMIWGAMPGNPYGHIGVFDSGDVNKFKSLDQNWPTGSITHLQDHNYNFVQGWLHPKTIQVTGTIDKSVLKGIVDGSGSDGDKLIAIRKLLV